VPLVARAGRRCARATRTSRARLCPSWSATRSADGERRAGRDAPPRRRCGPRRAPTTSAPPAARWPASRRDGGGGAGAEALPLRRACTMRRRCRRPRRGAAVIAGLFAAYRADPACSRPNGGRAAADPVPTLRTIGDFIAGMTDRYAIRQHARADRPGGPAGDPLRPLCRASRSGLDRGAVAVEPPRDPAHGDLATNAAMVLAKRAGTNPRALAGLIAPKLERCPRWRRRDRRARLHQPAAVPDVWRRSCARSWPGRDYGRSRHRRGAAGQRRICLGQPDRADAHGPLPRRGGRRRAGEPARGMPASRSPGILCQRRRRPGRYARPLGAPALPRGAGRGHRRHPGRAVSGRLSEAGRQALAAEHGDRFVAAPEASGCRRSARADRRGDAGPDPARPRAARHPPRPLRVRSRGAGVRRRRPRAADAARAKGLVYEGVLEAPKGLDAPTIGSRSS
jgi:hypothetical protein